jgi:hypothetical protein
MLKPLVFVVASALPVYMPRAFLLAPRSHGLYRFCAWEAILGLTLSNLPLWLRAPFF